jgi:signal peptidase I
MTPYPKSVARDYFETIVVCVIFVLFSRAFVFQQSKIPTGSMKNTLLVGDYIMVNKFVYGPAGSSLERAVLPMKAVERGDVVVFKYPEEPEVDYIKRVIGVPGDRIEVRHGQVFVNEEEQDEPYVRFLHPEPLRGSFGPVTVPEESYFCMGDNRDESADSRRWGYVPASHMKGRALLVWYSFDEESGAYLKTRWKDRAWNIANKVLHFHDKTRWSRIFSLIR